MYNCQHEKGAYYGNDLKEVFRDQAYNGLIQSSSWLFHRYGINCKLSGSVCAASEIEGTALLIHGPAGCAYHHRLTPMKLHAPIYNLQCTELNENDVINGGDKKLLGKILEIHQRIRPSLIVILPTCVSGLMGEDLLGICNETRSQCSCPTVCVSSEGFAHLGKESVDCMVEDFAKSWKDKKSPEHELKGCGQEQLMISLVDQLMEEQDVVEDMVNIESFAMFRHGSQQNLQNIKRILGEIGIKVNATLLGCTVNKIKTAPAAELNVVIGNRQGAKRMKEKFGTEYIRKEFTHYGIDGIETFFIEVGSRFGLEGEAEQVMKREKAQALMVLAQNKRLFADKKFAMICQDVFIAPYLAHLCMGDLGIPLSRFCLDTQLMRNMGTSDKAAKLVIRNMEELFSQWELGFDFIIGSSMSALENLAKDADWIISDRFIPSMVKDGHEMPLIDASSLIQLLVGSSMMGLVEFSNFIAKKICNKNRSRSRLLITSRFNYDKIDYPLIADPMSYASRSMWCETWSRNRSMGGD